MRAEHYSIELLQDYPTRRKADEDGGEGSADFYKSRKMSTDLLVSYFCIRQIRHSVSLSAQNANYYTPLNVELSGICVAVTVASRCEKNATMSAAVAKACARL